MTVTIPGSINVITDEKFEPHMAIKGSVVQDLIQNANYLYTEVQPTLVSCLFRPDSADGVSTTTASPSFHSQAQFRAPVDPENLDVTIDVLIKIADAAETVTLQVESKDSGTATASVTHTGDTSYTWKTTTLTRADSSAAYTTYTMQINTSNASHAAYCKFIRINGKVLTSITRGPLSSGFVAMDDEQGAENFPLSPAIPFHLSKNAQVIRENRRSVGFILCDGGDSAGGSAYTTSATTWTNLAAGLLYAADDIDQFQFHLDGYAGAGSTSAARLLVRPLGSESNDPANQSDSVYVPDSSGVALDVTGITWGADYVWESDAYTMTMDVDQPGIYEVILQAKSVSAVDPFVKCVVGWGLTQ